METQSKKSDIIAGATRGERFLSMGISIFLTILIAALKEGEHTSMGIILFTLLCLGLFTASVVTLKGLKIFLKELR